MLKSLLYTALLCLPLFAARAQNPVTDESLESQQFKQRLRSKYLHNDTAQAIITLYSTRQAGGVGWIVGSITSGLTTALVNRTSVDSSPYYKPAQPSTGERLGVAALVVTPLVGYGTAKLIHYSNAHLEQVLAAYAAGQPLSSTLRRRLKPRFFAQPIVQYKDVPVKPAN